MNPGSNGSELFDGKRGGGTKEMKEGNNEQQQRGDKRRSSGPKGTPWRFTQEANTETRSLDQGGTGEQDE